MKKARIIVVCTLVITMLAIMLSACGGAKTSSVATPAATAAATPAVTQAADTSKSEIYTMLDKVELDGVHAPVMPDRKSVEKALPKTKKEKITIGWTAGQMGSPFFVALIDGAKKKAASYGYEFSYTDANNDAQKMSSDMEAYVSKKVDAIVINPVDPKASIMDVKRAVAAGIPVIAVGAAFDGSIPAITAPNANNYYGGWNAGLYAGTYLKDKPIKVAVVLGRMGITISESRINGMLGGILYNRYKIMGKPFKSEQDAMLAGTKLYEELRSKGKAKLEEAKIELVGMGAGEWTQSGGMKATEDLIVANRDINVMLAENDVMGEGAINAMEQAGMKVGTDVVVVCAADSGRTAMDLIKQGKILVSGYQSPFQVGEACIELFHKMFAEGYDANNMPPTSDLPTIAVTKENVDQFYDAKSDWAKSQPFEWKTIDQINAGK